MMDFTMRHAVDGAAALTPAFNREALLGSQSDILAFFFCLPKSQWYYLEMDTDPLRGETAY